MKSEFTKVIGLFQLAVQNRNYVGIKGLESKVWRIGKNQGEFVCRSATTTYRFVWYIKTKRKSK